jgi:hypothetical protein
MLLITGLLGLSSLRVLIKALSFDATGFICSIFVGFCLRLCYICVIFALFLK